MFREFTLNEAMWILGGFPLSAKHSLKCNIKGISTDSRTIKPGELFIALIGENFDGHKFVEKAIENGACGCVVSDRMKGDGFDAPLIQVDNTEKSYGNLARWYLRRFGVERIALTGSAGKTTAREMITAILSTKGKVLRNEGNENNLIGVPKTIFKLNEEHDYIVLERPGYYSRN